MNASTFLDIQEGYFLLLDKGIFQVEAVERGKRATLIPVYLADPYWPDLPIATLRNGRWFVTAGVPIPVFPNSAEGALKSVASILQRYDQLLMDARARYRALKKERVQALHQVGQLGRV